MFKVNDHHTIRMFDPWEYLGPKRRKLLDSSWSGVFRKYLLEKLPVNKLVRYFDESMGRPSKELYTAMGTLILQQLHDLSDPEVTMTLAFNKQWHYALDITDESDASTYLSERTLRKYRKILIEEELDRDIFATLTDTLIEVFDVDTSKQRLDSTIIRSNMRKLGRIRIFTNTIRKFLKKPKEVPSDSLQNPSDPDAGYDSHKGQGYQAQIMETYQDEQEDDRKPNLITHVEVEPAHQHDANALHPAIDAVQKRDCCPKELTCDTLYGGDDNVREAADKGVEVIAPLKGPAPSHDISLTDFEIDETTQFVIRCPEGFEPDNVCRTRTNRIRARFSKKICGTCPHQKNCPVKLEKKAAFLRYDDKILRLAKRRAYEQTKEFKDRFRWRAGIEGTNSHLKSEVGVGRLRVRGMDSVRLAVVLKALGLNILRCAAALCAPLCPCFVRILDTKIAIVNRYNKVYDLFIILLSKNRCCLDFDR